MLELVLESRPTTIHRIHGAINRIWTLNSTRIRIWKSKLETYDPSIESSLQPRAVIPFEKYTHFIQDNFNN
jgi:hypothetical protein